MESFYSLHKGDDYELDSHLLTNYINYFQDILIISHALDDEHIEENSFQMFHRPERKSDKENKRERERERESVCVREEDIFLTCDSCIPRTSAVI